MARKALLVCGLLASLLYVGTDVFAALRYEGYSYVAQAVSELSAIGAPTRALVVPLFTVHGVLQIAFGLGVWMSADDKQRLRLAAALLIGIGLIDLAAYFSPMHVRGTEFTLTDTMHVINTAVTVLLILSVIGLGASANGKWFRLYSIATLVMLLLFGALTFMAGPQIAADQATPWIGVTERINIYGYMLWMAVLAVVLLRARDVAAPHGSLHGGAS
jgi:hypothetical protein